MGIYINMYVYKYAHMVMLKLNILRFIQVKMELSWYIVESLGINVEEILIQRRAPNAGDEVHSLIVAIYPLGSRIFVKEGEAVRWKIKLD